MPSLHAHDAARSEGTYGAVATCKRLSRGGATVLGRQAIASGPRRATAHTVASAEDRAVEIGCDRGEAHVRPAAIGDVEGECAVDPDAQGSVLPIGAFKATSWSILNRRPRGMLPRVAPAGCEPECPPRSEWRHRARAGTSRSSQRSLQGPREAGATQLCTTHTTAPIVTRLARSVGQDGFGRWVRACPGPPSSPSPLRLA